MSGMTRYVIAGPSGLRGEALETSSREFWLALGYALFAAGLVLALARSR